MANNLRSKIGVVLFSAFACSAQASTVRGIILGDYAPSGEGGGLFTFCYDPANDNNQDYCNIYGAPSPASPGSSAYTNICDIECEVGWRLISICRGSSDWTGTYGSPNSTVQAHFGLGPGYTILNESESKVTLDTVVDSDHESLYCLLGH